jgi:tetratricopeptide (TPR) repeat protein
MMARLLYSAVQATGEKTQGFVDAASSAEALARLREQGLTDVVLHEDAATGGFHPELQGLEDAEQREMARLQVKFRSEPGLPAALAEVLKKSAWWLMASLVAAIYGIWASSAVWAVVGSFALALPIALLLWNWRHTHRYVAMIRAYALGDWGQVRSLAARMRAAHIARVPLMQFDIDVRLARLAAMSQPLDDALSALKPWRDRLRDRPGVFEGRIAGVRFAAGDFDGYLRDAKAAAAAAPGELSTTIDLAMALARCGDATSAEDVLAKVDRGSLPPFAGPFVLWAQGLIEQRKRDRRALESLTQAVRDFLGQSAQPAAWTALALCACDRAIVLSDAGNIDEARRDIERVWPVLKAHVPPPLMTTLEIADLVPKSSA